jgi:hypothetical protein
MAKSFNQKLFKNPKQVRGIRFLNGNTAYGIYTTVQRYFDYWHMLDVLHSDSGRLYYSTEYQKETRD